MTSVTAKPVPLVELRNIEKRFGPVYALRGVSFDLVPGEVHALLGQNGAGKSTLIKLFAGVVERDAGEVMVNGEAVSFASPHNSRAAGIAIVYQELSLVPSMTVAANMFLGREPHNRLGVVDFKAIMTTAREFLRSKRFPLNGDEVVSDLTFAYRQLAEIAKALMGDVRVLVLDEPTSSLSAGEEEILFAAVKELTAQGVGVIYVTHRLQEVFRLSDRVTVLRDGRNAGTFVTSDTDMATIVATIVGSGRQDVRMAIAGLGPRGETATSPEGLQLTDTDGERAKAGRFNVGILLHTAASDWSKQQLSGIKETLAKYGADVIGIEDAAFSAERQVAQIQAMIGRRPDGIIGIPVDNTATADAFKSIGAAGIKLVLMDNVPKGLSAGTDYASVVSADNYGLGQVAAQMLADHIPPKGTVGVIGFGVDFFVTDQREGGFRKWVSDHRPDVVLKRTVFSEPRHAGEVGLKFLIEHPEVNGLFVVWDEPAMQVVQALRVVSRLIPVTTIDLGNEAALELAKGSSIKGIAAQQPFDQGVAEAEALLQALLGNEIPSWVALQAVPVDRKGILQTYERVSHAKAPRQLVDAIGSAAAIEERSKQAPQVAAAAEPEIVLELKEVGNERLRGVNLKVRRGEILGVAGLIGSGRTEILETIFGLRRIGFGEMLIEGSPVGRHDPLAAIRRGIALAPEDRHLQGLIVDDTIERNTALPRLEDLTKGTIFQRKESNARARTAIADLSIKAPGITTRLRNLSGGNQQKVVFGKWLSPRPTVLLLDEPTNGVDVGARADIYAIVRQVAEQGTAVVVVSSDLSELQLLCDRVCIVADGRIVNSVPRSAIKNEAHLHQMVQEA